MNRNQLGNIFTRLKPKLVLHEDGLDLGELLVQEAAPSSLLGSWDQPATGTFFDAVAHKAPKKIVLSDALPKTERGKFDLKALVELFLRHSGFAGTLVGMAD